VSLGTSGYLVDAETGFPCALRRIAVADERITIDGFLLVAGPGQDSCEEGKAVRRRRAAVVGDGMRRDGRRGSDDRPKTVVYTNYQPIIDMQSGTIAGAETLARWHHPTRGWIGPAVFIALAEELNLVDRIDAFVLRQACTQGRAWADAGQPRLRIAVNLSGSNLTNPDLVANVAATLADSGFPAADLELELTEGVVIAESDGALATLDGLKALGLRLAIDDFGTGYSALSRLRELPFDTLKVDKIFVDELDSVHPGSTLAESILDMARVLGLKVVAEGVETSRQADFLRTHGCDFAQGYLFSRPVGVARFEALLQAGATRTGVIEPAVA
jgi:EAL domain-containing protein (putative c-di-GMP-specific phosphodiesterase class I)